MKTSCFAGYKGPGRICIARYAPRGTPAGYRVFKALAPGEWFKSVSKEQYMVLYDGEILAPLDPQKTWDTLHELAGGVEPVLLCWEKPPLTADNWCHRRIVSEWFESRLGVVVPELGFESEGPEKELKVDHDSGFPPALSGAIARPFGGLCTTMYDSQSRDLTWLPRNTTDATQVVLKAIIEKNTRVLLTPLAEARAYQAILDDEVTIE
ncbi:MAG: DUF488 domain-containing protein, partial [Polyangiaceae bacterium]|nr:DUF488 domain-containing protein [Polyangiaceae bacterium]